MVVLGNDDPRAASLIPAANSFARAFSKLRGDLVAHGGDKPLTIGKPQPELILLRDGSHGTLDK